MVRGAVYVLATRFDDEAKRLVSRPWSHGCYSFVNSTSQKNGVHMQILGNKSPCIGFLERSPSLRCRRFRLQTLLLKRERLNLNLSNTTCVTTMANTTTTTTHTSPPVLHTPPCIRR